MPARLGEALQARGDVDAVAVDRAVGLLDDLAEIDADPVAHAAIVGDRGAALLHRRLSGYRGTHRAGGRREHRQDRVSGHVDDAPAVLLGMEAEERAVRVELARAWPARPSP